MPQLYQRKLSSHKGKPDSAVPDMAAEHRAQVCHQFLLNLETLMGFFAQFFDGFGRVRGNQAEKFYLTVRANALFSQIQQVLMGFTRGPDAVHRHD
jgi:hypothetical protein